MCLMFRPLYRCVVAVDFRVVTEELPQRDDEVSCLLCPDAPKVCIYHICLVVPLPCPPGTWVPCMLYVYVCVCIFV